MSNLIVQTYLYFDGRCEEALEFYKSAIGAEVNFMMRFKDSPEQPAPGCGAPNSENKIMHAQFSIGSTVIMASDGRCTGHPKFDGFGLSIAVATVEETERLFKALSAGGQVQMPLTKTFFSPSFGMVIDKFGVSWMILVSVK